MKLAKVRQKLKKGKQYRRHTGSALLGLPHDILGYILTLVPLEDHAKCLQVCKRLNEAGSRQWVWRQRYCKDFGPVADSEDWRLSYARRFRYWALRTPHITTIAIDSATAAPSKLVSDVDYDGKSLVVSAGSHGGLQYWNHDTASGGEVATDPALPLYSCLIDSDRNTVYCGSVEGKCLLLNTSTMTWASEIPVLERADTVCCAISCPFGIVFAGSRGTLGVLRENGVIKVKSAHSAAVNAIAYSSKHCLLLTASSDGHIKMWQWSPAHARLLCCRKFSLDLGSSDLSSLAVYEDSFFAGGYADGTIHEYSLLDGNEVGRLSGHQRTVRAMHIDGRYLVTGSYDCTVRLWDVRGKKLLHIVGEELVRSRWVLCVCLRRQSIVFGAGPLCTQLEFH